MALPYLLSAARLVQLDDSDQFLALEVGGRVVEGQVAVLSNSHDADGRIQVLQQASVTFKFALHGREVTLDAVKFLGMDVVDQVFLHPPAKAGRMIFRHP